MNINFIMAIRKAVLKATFDAILARDDFRSIVRKRWSIADER